MLTFPYSVVYWAYFASTQRAPVLSSWNRYFRPSFSPVIRQNGLLLMMLLSIARFSCGIRTTLIQTTTAPSAAKKAYTTV